MTFAPQTPLWTADAVAQAIGSGSRLTDWSATGVSIDSRTLNKGDLFIALTGPNREGHDYVASSLEAGAAAAVISKDVTGLSANAPVLRVADTQEALESLGRTARERSAAKRIAVTGSVGKTGTKEMLRHILSAQGSTHASVASYNNLWGVPLTLARMPADTTYGVFEIGMNHAGEITPLTEQVAPQIAIVTTVAPVHLEFFDSVASIADAKGEIFSGLVSPAVAVIGRDHDYYDRLEAAARHAGAGDIVSFGQDKAADIRLLSCKPHLDGSLATALFKGRELSFVHPQPGLHVVVNALGVLGAVDAIGGDILQAIDSLPSLGTMRGRGETSLISAPQGAFTLVDESYNANPVSMAAAIQTLGQRQPKKGGRRIAVLGDMLELGSTEVDLHASLAEPLSGAEIDQVFLCGPLMKVLWQRLDANTRGAYAPSSGALKNDVLDAVKQGDVVMVKGSLGSKMGLLVEALKTLDQSDRDDARHARVGGP